MNGKLLDLSERIDSLIVGFLETIATTADSLDVPFFIVGAMARDIILELGYGIETGRATVDIDLGVQVSDWADYKRLREALTSTGEFILDNRRAQRILYKDDFPIDVIPFGTIADPNNSLSWPPEQENTMSTLGFEEAYESSITLRVRANPVLDVKLVSLPGLALLKLMSWNDNPHGRRRDARDLLLILSTYLDAGNQIRLYEEEVDLIGEDFDYVFAGARLLGRDMAAILNPKTKEATIRILDRETGEKEQYKLVENMINIGAGRDAFEDAKRLLEELKLGIVERL